MGSNGCRREFYYEDSSSTESEWPDEDSEEEDSSSSGSGSAEDDGSELIDEDQKSALKRGAQELLDHSQPPTRPIDCAGNAASAAAQQSTSKAASAASKSRVKVKCETKAGLAATKNQPLKVKGEAADGDTSDSTFLPDYSESSDSSSDEDQSSGEEDDDEDTEDEVDEPTVEPTQSSNQAQHPQGPCCGRCKAALPPPPPTDQPVDPKCDCCKVSFAPNVRTKTRPGRAVFRTHLCCSCLPNATAVLTRLAKFSRPSHLMCTGCNAMLAITAFKKKQQWYRYRKKCGPRFCVMCLSSDFVKLGNRIAAKLVTCSKCMKTLPRTSFAASQQRFRSDEVDYPDKTYTCRACHNNSSTNPGIQTLHCAVCTQTLPCRQFSKAQRKASNEHNPNGNTAPPTLTCKACKENGAKEIVMLDCAHCKKTLQAKAFPKAQQKKANQRQKGCSYAIPPARYCKLCWPHVTSEHSSVIVTCSRCAKALPASAFSRKHRDLFLKSGKPSSCMDCNAKAAAARREQSDQPKLGSNVVKTDPLPDHNNNQVIKKDSSPKLETKQSIKTDLSSSSDNEDPVKANVSRKRDHEDDSDNDVVFLRVVAIKR